MKLALDVMGGDHAPEAVLDGLRTALLSTPAETVFQLYGDGEVIKAYIRDHAMDASRLTVVPTGEVITCEEAPTLAIRRKKDSSLVRALNAVASGTADCFLSAGSSGAILAGGTLIVRRIAGVKRPALAPLLPTVTGGHVMLIDCGANTDCKPAYLQQFALMGKAYMQRVMGVEEPRIGLLNNGAEAEKGNELTKTVYPLLAAMPQIRFVGNCEARDVMSGDFDVIVCDGFDGNIVLKSIEGAAKTMNTLLKRDLLATPVSKFGALLSKRAFSRFKKRMDYTEVGGAPLLGVGGGVIKAHGSSNANAIFHAILQAQKLSDANVTGQIASSIAELPLED